MIVKQPHCFYLKGGVHWLDMDLEDVIQRSKKKTCKLELRGRKKKKVKKKKKRGGGVGSQKQKGW